RRSPAAAPRRTAWPSTRRATSTWPRSRGPSPSVAASRPPTATRSRSSRPARSGDARHARSRRPSRGPASSAHSLRDGDELLVLAHPVVGLAEGRERHRERGILPPARDPARHVDDAEGAQRLRERQRRAIELAEELVAREQILALALRLLRVPAGQQPEI